MKLYRKSTSKKYMILTDKGTQAYVVKGYIDVKDKDDIKYLEDRGFKQIKEKKGDK